LRCAPVTSVSILNDAERAYQVSSGRRAKILVVEDEPDVRQFMVESLEILGYAVIEAEHGEAGYQYLLRETPDLMITDFLMPGMTGAELVKKAAAHFPGLPMIIATGYADSVALEAAVDGGAVLRKPFRINELANTVKRALALHH
jgi:CheY-like chemotaxis protein